MKNKPFLWLAQMAVLAMALSSGVVAQNRPPLKLTGTISDYTTITPGAQSQLWEMRGTWTLKTDHDFDSADFTAELNMEHSDFAMSNGQTSRTQHTHHISLKNAQVQDQNFVLANCPSVHYTPATTTGFAITGLASTTGNGALAPFAPQGQQSQLTVCITGSDQVTFSNITLVFPATLTDGTTKNPASGHFGTQPINGVVKSTEPSRRGDDGGRN